MIHEYQQTLADILVIFCKPKSEQRICVNEAFKKPLGKYHQNDQNQSTFATLLVHSANDFDYSESSESI